MDAIKHIGTSLFVLICWYGSVYAETDSSSAPDTSKSDVPAPRGSVDFNINAVLSLLTQGVEKDGPFNVDNRYALLPENSWETELRPELRAATNYCSGLLKPRMRWNGSDIEGQTAYGHEFFVNTALVKCKAPSLDISVGRQSIQWGNGQFRSPSNPFFAESLQFNPAQEVLGKDFITLSAQTQREWSGMLIVHTGDNHIDPDEPYFRRDYGVKLGWVGEASTGGLIWSQRNGRPPRLGGHWTTTWSDATLLYGEATISRDAAGFIPAQDASGSIRMEPAQEVSNDHRHTVLLGASYTFENGVPAYAEYINTTEGLSSHEAKLWTDLAHQVASGAPVDGDQIGRMIDPRWRQARRNYALLQVAVPDEKERGDLALRYVVNLDDHGSIIALATTYNVGGHGQWFLYAARNIGGAEGEFGRLQKYAIQTGVRIYGF